MRVATRVTYSINIVLGYAGTLPQRCSSFANMLFEIQNEPFHSCLLRVVGDCLHRTGFRKQTAIVRLATIRAHLLLYLLAGHGECISPGSTLNQRAASYAISHE